MASTTGIEIGPDSCVLAGVRQARSAVAEVRALHVIEQSDWPSQDLGLTTMLRAVRRGKGFPRRARVVAWSLQEPVSAGDPVAIALIRPVTEAGFRVERILTPPEALAQLAASRPRSSGEGAVAWLSLNMHGAAIAIVRGTELLFARTFEWSYNPMAAGSRAQLLQRYTLIAQLAPELRRGMTVVRDATGVTVDAAVTCGDLPDLRSLTMPLIEELDLEVETLDSTDGLRAVGKAKAERFAESAPIMRLACAVAAARVQRPSPRAQSLLRIAAALALVAGLGWGAYAFSTRWIGGPVDPARSAPVKTPKSVAAPPPARNPSSTQRAANPPTDRKGAPPLTSSTAPVPSGAKPAVITPAQPPAAGNSAAPASAPAQSASAPAAANVPRSTKMPISAMGGSSSTASAPAMSAPATAVTTAMPPKPAVKVPPPAPALSWASVPRTISPSASAASAPAASPPAASPPAASPPAGVNPAPSVASSSAKPAAPRPAAPEASAPEVKPVPAASAPAPSSAAVAAPAVRTVGKEPTRSPGPRLTPLTDPLPKIESILIDQDRRLAIVDGGIVGVGDAVGLRVVTGIDRDGVVFREPSGLAIRVRLRSRADG